MARLILLSMLLAAVGGCASIPKELKSGGPYADVNPQQVQSDDYKGRQVRWGGIIIQTTPQNGKTCFEVLGLPLDRTAEPQRNDHSIGRFIACANSFYDPAIYDDGRAVTFTGTISGIRQQKVGEYMYGFPLLDANTVYLWPKRPSIVYVPYQDPFWDPFWPYYYYPYPYPYRHHRVHP